MTAWVEKSTPFVPSREDVTAFYDTAGLLISSVAGRNSHSGYWTSETDRSALPEATDALTDVVIEQLDVGAGSRVLDVGAGLGGPAVRLAVTTGTEVVGIDTSTTMIGEARTWAEEQQVADRVEFLEADAMAPLPLPPASFDAAMVVESFVHMSDRAAALRQIGSALAPGGRVVITDFYERTPFTGERLAMNDSFRRMMLNSPFPTLEDYARMTRAAGLEITRLVDTTDRVNRYYTELATVLREMAGSLGGEYGSEAMAGLEQVCHNCVATGEPNYLIVTAVRAPR